MCEVTSSNSDRILVREVTSYDRILKERDAVFITFVSKHVCYSPLVILQLFVHKVVSNVRNPKTVSHIRGTCLGRKVSGNKFKKIAILC